MAVNITPIFSKVGDVQWLNLAAASAAIDGTGASLLFTADATNGGRVEKVRFKALGTNIATVARIFVNNGSTPATAANNVLFAEITLPGTTASAVASTAVVELPASGESAFPLVLPPSYRLYVALGTAVAAGYHITAVGGKY